MTQEGDPINHVGNENVVDRLDIQDHTAEDENDDTAPWLVAHSKCECNNSEYFADGNIHDEYDIVHPIIITMRECAQDGLTPSGMAVTDYKFTKLTL